MYVLSFFYNLGKPATGLTPTIRIRDISDNSLVITDDNMEETGDGFYKYNFSTYDRNKQYSVRSDGGPSLFDAERYTYGGNEVFVADIAEAVWDVVLSSHLMPGTTGKALTDITINSIYSGFGS